MEALSAGIQVCIIMDDSLKAESEKLSRSWQQHDAEWLRKYLVGSVEDPRTNLQSIFSRHFLIRALFEDRYVRLMQHEYRFATAMNWLTRLAGKACENEELGIVLRALRRGFDNAEGISLPAFLLQTFASLPVACDELTIPNYVESFLSGTKWVDGKPQFDEESLETFRQLWSQALARFVLLAGGANPPRISVLGRRAVRRMIIASCTRMGLPLTSITLASI